MRSVRGKQSTHTHHKLWRLPEQGEKWCAGAEQVHGITPERLRAEGQAAPGELDHFRSTVAEVAQKPNTDNYNHVFCLTCLSTYWLQDLPNAHCAGKGM